jgi:hypothetical protein
MTGIEALHDAIQQHEGWHPGSRSNRNRNPGNLRAAATVPHSIDARGYCVFGSVVAGSAALLYDLHAKITGHSVHALTPDSTLDDLFEIYAPRADHNNPNAYALAVAEWCTVALGRTITTQTTLRALCPELFVEANQT